MEGSEAYALGVRVYDLAALVKHLYFEVVKLGVINVPTHRTAYGKCLIYGYF